MEKDLFEQFKQFIRETVRAYLAEVENISIFDKLEDVSSTEELAKSLRCSSDVVLRMAQKGMPHTHAGREYRFHKALLIEWTRTGQNPFPCVACQTSETEKQSVQQSEEPQSTNLRPIRPEISHKSANKLASLVGGN